MDVTLVHIELGEVRDTSTPGGPETEDFVDLDVGGTRMRFSVRTTWVPESAVPGFMNPGPRLAELLRFAPAAKGEVLRAVARMRRGESVQLPLPLVASAAELAAG
jgi:hypothetical protein